MGHINNRHERGQRREILKRVQYLNPAKLKLFIKPRDPFYYKSSVQLVSEAFGRTCTASLLVRWEPKNDSYFIEYASVAIDYRKYARNGNFRDPILNVTWVRKNQLKELVKENSVLMVWQVLRRPSKENLKLKISHVPTDRVIQDWYDADKLPEFGIRNSCTEAINSFLS